MLDDEQIQNRIDLLIELFNTHTNVMRIVRYIIDDNIYFNTNTTGLRQAIIRHIKLYFHSDPLFSNTFSAMFTNEQSNYIYSFVLDELVRHLFRDVKYYYLQYIFDDDKKSDSLEFDEEKE